MALIKSTFKRWNGTEWDIHYFETSADIVQETTSFKVLTSAERTKISDHLTTFNAANKLLRLDGSGLIPTSLIPGGLNYLDTANPTFTGTLTGSSTGKAVLPGGVEYRAGVSIVSPAGDTLRFLIGQDYIQLTEQGLDMNSSRLVGLPEPSIQSEAATKEYVDNLISTGTVPIPSVKAATTGNITLSGTSPIDTIGLSPGDRVLVKNQTTTSQNGIYTVASGAWTKVTAQSTQGALVFVESGAINNDSKWYAESNTSWILFSKVDTIGTIANGGLQKIGTNLGIQNSGVTNAMLAGSIDWNKLLSSPSSDAPGWAGLAGTLATPKTLSTHISDLYSAIRNLRGTVAWNTNNSITIASTNSLAAGKNKTYIGQSDPATTGFVEGDVYLQEIV